MQQTTKSAVSSAAFTDSKPHYALLDGLRGAAALMVVWYHVFEGFAFAGGGVIENFNHGHLGVDFFFMLSGFVISYAYDDRWQAQKNNRLTLVGFFKRRLIRLHPMIILGAIIGCVTYLLQGGVKWDGSAVSFSHTIIALVLAMLLIPVHPGASYDVRGNGEMFPLNGPSWSLFFEYIGNILYALFIRRLSNKALGTLTALLAIVWVWFVAADISGYNMIGIGCTIDNANFFGGLLRMLFPFSAGMLLARNFRPIKVKGIFWISIAVLFILFSMPYIPKNGNISLNGLYELFCIVFVFPVIVWLAASGETDDKLSGRVCKFLGDISYPLYIVHYPVMYLFYAWLIDNKYYTLGETWAVVIMVFAINIILAYASLKLYDEPVRRLLTKRYNRK